MFRGEYGQRSLVVCSRCTWSYHKFCIKVVNRRSGRPWLCPVCVEETQEAAPGCAVCGRDDRHDAMLLCDGPGLSGKGCELEHHMDCLVPPVTSLPTGSWFCPVCSPLCMTCAACERPITTKSGESLGCLHCSRAVHLSCAEGVENGPWCCAACSARPDMVNHSDSIAGRPNWRVDAATAAELEVCLGLRAVSSTCL